MLAGASYDLHEKDIQLTHRCSITSIDAPHKPETSATVLCTSTQRHSAAYSPTLRRRATLASLSPKTLLSSALAARRMIISTATFTSTSAVTRHTSACACSVPPTPSPHVSHRISAAARALEPYKMGRWVQCSWAAAETLNPYELTRSAD